VATRVTIPVLENAHVVFWDFDGVIKDSVNVKTEAFEQLFRPFGGDIADRVRAHHEANGGLSRFEKIPLYLTWAGALATPDDVDRYCALFGHRVRDAVIHSPWVPGVREYLLEHRARQRFVLITATPQAEIGEIVDAIGLRECFREIHGAPTPKAAAIASVLSRWSVAPADALVIGDATADRDAAGHCGVPFLLRRTPLNVAMQREHHGASFETLA
jgi:phosphoglycolate phosphatase-like HAD superfamily hydrolase